MTKKWSVFIAIGMVVLFSCYCAGNPKEVTDGNYDTLKNTIEGASVGDIIKISGTYKFPSRITVNKAITILSENGAVFDGSNCRDNAIDINAKGVTLAGLTICNFSNGKDTDVGIIYVKKACEIKNLVFSNNCSGGSCIYVTDDGGSAVSAVVTDCTFSGNGAMNGESGGKGVIHITSTGMWTVVGCAVVSNSMCGVCIDKGGLMKNTVVAGNRSGVYIKKGTMLNCTVCGNDSPDAGSGLVMESGTAVNNIIYGNGGTTNALVKEGCTFNTNLVDVLPDVGVGNIAANPMLANPDALDFSLTISSPAINGGATLAEVHCDIAGVARPQAGAYDIGAYEFKADSVACGIVVMKSDWPQGSEPSVFSRVIGAPAGAQISYRWFLDGVELAGETGASVVLPQTLACGPHDMKLIVTVNGDVQPEVVRNGVITVLPTGGVPYLDWDEENGKMTNATISVSDYEPVTSETREFADGKWYVVAENVVIENGGNIKVNGSAHLILCDNASLTIKSVANSAAAIDVSVSGSTTNSLTIYGQQGGSGVLSATGGMGGAGIGGGAQGAGGTVTINGGTVTATGGQFGAGIGGGGGGAGGTVTVNGGTVTANGGTGAGIGGGDGGAGGSVTVNGGLVTANGSSGIGGGVQGAGGTVTINGGTVTANGIRGAGIGGMNGNHGTVTFGAGAWLVLAGYSAPGSEVSASAYASDHSAMYVSIEPSLKPPLSLKIPAGVHYSYVVSNETTGAVLKGEFADGTNTYVVKNGSTVKVYFTLDEDYMWDGEFDNPKDLGVIESDKVVDAFEMPKTKGLPGSETNPWKVGENVTAYIKDRVLYLKGTGAMSNFVSAADVPWVPATVKKVTVDVSKIQIGANSLSALADGTLVNETLVSNIRPYVPGFTSSTPVQPAGSISPAEFERIDIVDGKALLGVSVYTNASLEVEKVGGGGDCGWGVATNGVIEVPAPGKQGFFILKSKPAAVSNRSGRPDTADIPHD